MVAVIKHSGHMGLGWVGGVSAGLLRCSLVCCQTHLLMPSCGNKRRPDRADTQLWDLYLHSSISIKNRVCENKHQKKTVCISSLISAGTRVTYICCCCTAAWLLFSPLGPLQTQELGAAHIFHPGAVGASQSCCSSFCCCCCCCRRHCS